MLTRDTALFTLTQSDMNRNRQVYSGSFFIVLITGLLLSAHISNAQATGSNPLSVDGFSGWTIGRDRETVQLIPATGVEPLRIEDGKSVAHARFQVKQYGEIWFPINQSGYASPGVGVNLSRSKFLKVRYKSNQPVILQLRQTGAHGGTHNHVTLPASTNFRTATISMDSFKGGLEPLNLKDVEKFNFAVLGNNQADGYADLVVVSFVIDRYKPLLSR